MNIESNKRYSMSLPIGNSTWKASVLKGSIFSNDYFGRMDITVDITDYPVGVYLMRIIAGEVNNYEKAPKG